MIDFETLVTSLQERGYNVERIIEVPENAGKAELVVDGNLITLAEARQLLVDSEPKPKKL